MMKSFLIISIIIAILIGVTGLMTIDPPRQIDFKDITLPSAENFFLMCPKQYSNITRHAISPVFPVDLDTLEQRWQKMIAKQKNITLVASDQQQHQYTYIQRTPIFRFPDTINVKLISLDDNQSTLAMMSQSKYGYSDLGTNQKRVHAWIKELMTDKTGENR